jgi:hypothetical protein
MKSTLVKLHSCVPHKSELKDEHFLMAGAYGTGAFVSHTVIGTLILSFAYLIVFVTQVYDHHCEHKDK